MIRVYNTCWEGGSSDSLSASPSISNQEPGSLSNSFINSAFNLSFVRLVNCCSRESSTLKELPNPSNNTILRICLGCGIKTIVNVPLCSINSHILLLLGSNLNFLCFQKVVQ